MSTEAKITSFLLLLPVTPAPSYVWPLRQSKMHVENRGLCHQARKCFYNWIGHGGE